MSTYGALPSVGFLGAGLSIGPLIAAGRSVAAVAFDMLGLPRVCAAAQFHYNNSGAHRPVASGDIDLSFARSPRRKARKAKLTAQLFSFLSPMKNVQMKSIRMYHRSQGEGCLFVNDK